MVAKILLIAQVVFCKVEVSTPRKFCNLCKPFLRLLSKRVDFWNEQNEKVEKYQGVLVCCATVKGPARGIIEHACDKASGAKFFQEDALYHSRNYLIQHATFKFWCF